MPVRVQAAAGDCAPVSALDGGHGPTASNVVAAPSGCRMGSCHSCSASILSGAVRHDPEPLQPPAQGSALLCCALPLGDVVLDA
jgi:ferredoxin